MGKNEFGKLGVGSDEKYIDRLKDVKLVGEVRKRMLNYSREKKTVSGVQSSN